MSKAKKSARQQKKEVRKEARKEKKEIKKTVPKSQRKSAKKAVTQKKKTAIKQIKKSVPKKQTIKKAAQKIAKKVKNIKPAKVLKDIAHKAGEAAKFVILAPYMAAMLLALKKKGVKVPHPLNTKEVSSLFYVNIIQGQHLEHCEHLDNYTTGNVAYNQASKLFKLDHGRENLVEEAASGIIKAIIDYFTGRKKQKEAQDELAETGEVSEENELTEDEEAVVPDEPVTEEETEVIEEFDNANDQLAEEIGGEDSEGNVHVNEDDVIEEAEDLERKNLDGSNYGVMKFINRF